MDFNFQNSCKWLLWLRNLGIEVHPSGGLLGWRRLTQVFDIHPSPLTAEKNIQFLSFSMQCSQSQLTMLLRDESQFQSVLKGMVGKMTGVWLKRVPFLTAGLSVPYTQLTFSHR